MKVRDTFQYKLRQINKRRSVIRNILEYIIIKDFDN